MSKTARKEEIASALLPDTTPFVRPRRVAVPKNGSGGNGVFAHRHVSPEEYLRLETSADNKSEYIRGRIYPMPGVRLQHDTIAGNIFTELHIQLKRKPCAVHSSDVRVQVNEGQTPVDYFYPDVTVVCGPPRLNGIHLLNPTLVVEVLSDSTQEYDQTTKFDEYKNIESLQEVLFVAQDKPNCVLWSLSGAGVWEHLEKAAAEGESLVLNSIGCILEIAELYAKVSFDAAP